MRVFHDKDKEPYGIYRAWCASMLPPTKLKVREWLANELYKADDTAPTR